MNQFGGDWTITKIEVFIDYLKAYLQIMKKGRGYWELIYFDGFAGSGKINLKGEERPVEGVALRVMSIEKPISFNTYYFVDRNKENASSLKEKLADRFPDKRAFVTSGDCNEKLVGLANYIKQDIKKRRALAFIDPYGMQVNWDSIASLKGLGVDMWILVPTGVGANRLLNKDGQVKEVHQAKLESFLGIPFSDIKERLYQEDPQLALFEADKKKKVENSIERLGEIYCERLRDVFEHVSKPLALRNSSNTTMYHFILGSRVSTAVKIANDIIKKPKAVTKRLGIG